MKVVLDSNIIIADFWMKTPGFRILFENSKKGDIELYIPQVVIDEVTNKFNQRIDKFKTDIQSEVSRLERLSELTFGITVPEAMLKKAKAKYKAYLEKMIKNNGITIIEYPKANHEYLAKKAMMGRKPFNANEKGYRDNLIWENIKSLISPIDEDVPATPELVFLSNNYNDFAGEDNKLHQDLKTELEEEGLNPDSVAIYSVLSEFNEKVSKLLFAQASLFAEKLSKSEFGDFDLKSEIDEYLFKKFTGSDLDNYYKFARYANDRPTVSTVNDDYKIQKVSARKLNTKEFIVDVWFNLDVEMDYYIDKSDYWSSDDINVHVIDSNWNDHVVAVSDSVTLSMEMTLVINSRFECTSIEINKINNEYMDGSGDEYG